MLNALILSAMIQTGNIRTTVLQVESVNKETNVISWVDSTGHSWETSGVEDWEVGDVASCLFDTKGTDEIYDDEIYDLSYCFTAEKLF